MHLVRHQSPDALFSLTRLTLHTHCAGSNGGKAPLSSAHGSSLLARANKSSHPVIQSRTITPRFLFHPLLFFYFLSFSILRLHSTPSPSPAGAVPALLPRPVHHHYPPSTYGIPDLSSAKITNPHPAHSTFLSSVPLDHPSSPP